MLSQGWKAKKATIVDPWVRFTDATGLSANGTNAELAKAQELTAFPDESMLNAYVVIKNAVPGSSSPILPQRYYTLQDGSNLYVLAACGTITLMPVITMSMVLFARMVAN